MIINKLIEEKIASGMTADEAREAVKNEIDTYNTEPNTDDTLSQIKKCIEKGDLDGARVLLGIQEQVQDESEKVEGDKNEEKEIKKEEDEIKKSLEDLEKEIVSSDKIDRETRHTLSGAMNNIFKMINGDK